MAEEEKEKEPEEEGAQKDVEVAAQQGAAPRRERSEIRPGALRCSGAG